LRLPCACVERPGAFGVSLCLCSNHRHASDFGVLLTRDNSRSSLSSLPLSFFPLSFFFWPLARLTPALDGKRQPLITLLLTDPFHYLVLRVVTIRISCLGPKNIAALYSVLHLAFTIFLRRVARNSNASEAFAVDFLWICFNVRSKRETFTLELFRLRHSNGRQYHHRSCSCIIGKAVLPVISPPGFCTSRRANTWLCTVRLSRENVAAIACRYLAF